MQEKNISFRKTTGKDKPIILDWLKEPHVNEFYYGDGLKNTLSNIDLHCKGINNNGSYTFHHWIAFYDNTPFAFLMTSPIEGPFDENDDYSKWYVDGKKTFTLDLLIGNRDFLGKGLACKMIRQFILDKYADADFFIIDPEKTNTKAIHVYEKAGFKSVGEFIPEWSPKPHIIMQLDIVKLNSKKN